MTLEELQARGHGPLGLACTYLTTQDQRFFLPEVKAAGIPVTTIGVASIEAIDRTVAIAIKALPVDMSSVIDYAAVFAAKRPAIAHLWMDEVNTLAGIAAVATGVPRVILGQHSGPPHHFVFHQPYMREAYRWLARQSGVTLVNCSDSGARAYERWIGLPQDTIRSIHNGFRFDDSVLNCYRADRGHYRARFSIPADAPLIGTVFRMSEEKRPLLWLEIAALVRRAMPQARFLVVGGGPLREQIEVRAAANDLAGAVHFAGYERNVFAAIADMDLFLLCSRIEGLPNVLIEAQTLGVPVVTTKAGGAAETLVDGVTGIVLKDIDPMTAAAVIVELLQDEDRLCNMRRRAPAFVASTFNIERTVNEILKVYAGVGGTR
jgi:glycosyltransferase involved in cell wall biosynthesis